MPLNPLWFSLQWLYGKIICAVKSAEKTFWDKLLRQAILSPILVSCLQPTPGWNVAGKRKPLWLRGSIDLLLETSPKSLLYMYLEVFHLLAFRYVYPPVLMFPVHWRDLVIPSCSQEDTHVLQQLYTTYQCSAYPAHNYQCCKLGNCIEFETTCILSYLKEKQCFSVRIGEESCFSGCDASLARSISLVPNAPIGHWTISSSEMS